MGWGCFQPQDFSGQEGTDAPSRCVCPTVTLLQVQGKSREQKPFCRTPLWLCLRLAASLPRPHPTRAHCQLPSASSLPVSPAAPTGEAALQGSVAGWWRWPVPCWGRRSPGSPAPSSAPQPRLRHSRGFVPGPSSSISTGVAGISSGGRREAEPPSLGWGHCSSPLLSTPRAHGGCFSALPRAGPSLQAQGPPSLGLYAFFLCWGHGFGSCGNTHTPHWPG